MRAKLVFDRLDLRRLRFGFPDRFRFRSLSISAIISSQSIDGSLRLTVYVDDSTMPFVDFDALVSRFGERGDNDLVSS